VAKNAIRAPDWDRLFEFAAAQDGLFTTSQAAESGYSPQLLAHHLSAGRMLRVRRGIYRLVHFPAGDHEDLTTIWLWSEQVGVFSHQTALALHDLSDILPSLLHLTLPESERNRRLRIPDGIVLYYSDIPTNEQQWFGPVPITAPLRTLEDCARENLPPELLRGGALDALHRGLVTRPELSMVDEALGPFGGLEP